jgi:hypothetical protein
LREFFADISLDGALLARALELAHVTIHQRHRDAAKKMRKDRRVSAIGY